MNLLTVSVCLFLGASVPTGFAFAQSDHPVETDELRTPRLKTGGSCVIRNVTIHSATSAARVGDVLVIGGDIKGLDTIEAPEGMVEIDGTGKHLAPGVVDCHSHIAVNGGMNEGSVSIAAEVDISDVINPDDLAIYRALAGGVTTVRSLHGSANAIGGKHEVIKLKWGRTADQLRFPDAPEGVKFALGENPKQSNGSRDQTRFPGTRMGVEAVFGRAFERALEYREQWRAYEAAVAAGEDSPSPRRDLRLDSLVGILEGEIAVACHAYRADEILMFARVAQRYGLQNVSLHHALEAYKVADELAEAGVSVTTFGDWWAYKVEAYDAIPQCAALLEEAGVLTSLHSDSGELMRRLYVEAAKSIRYASLDRVKALALVTLYPARQLGIDARVGSIELDKDADLVLLDGDPLSSLSRVEWTMVDGEIEFERRDAFGFDTEPLVAATAEGEQPPPIEWDPQGGDTVAIVGGTIHPITAPSIEKGTLLLQGERILYVGGERTLPAAARVIDATGKHVWPGIIALNTPLGLREIGSVRATNDTSEIGGNQPDVRVLASINADSAHIAVTRANGVTRAQVAPAGAGPMMGQSALIDLVGDTWEELSTVEDDMLHIRFPRVANRAEEKEIPEAVEEMSTLLSRARDYDRLREESVESDSPPPPFDPRLEALVPHVRKERKVALHADNAQTILLALKFAGEEDLDVVLFGATEGWKVADHIARAGIPVVVGPVLTVPRSEFDPYDAAFANAAVLVRAGVEIAIQSRDRGNPRNVAFHAAMASAFGLPREEARRAITWSPARILGVEDELGSLEAGKIADLVITDGDLLEVSTRTEYVFIDGAQVSLSNRQTEFHDRYRNRLRKRRQDPDR